MESMTIERLTHLLDAYGAEPASWPVDARAPALALIAASPQARALVDDARALDSALARVRPPRPSPALVARISAMIGARRLRPVPLAALALAASLLLGLGVALWPAAPETDGFAGLMIAAPAGVDTVDIGLVEDAPATNDRRVVLALY